MLHLVPEAVWVIKVASSIPVISGFLILFASLCRLSFCQLLVREVSGVNDKLPVLLFDLKDMLLLYEALFLLYFLLTIPLVLSLNLVLNSLLFLVLSFALVLEVVCKLSLRDLEHVLDQVHFVFGDFEHLLVDFNRGISELLGQIY